jgi:hypothetical protein
MNKQKSIDNPARNLSRRAVMKTGALAAFGATLSPSLATKRAGPPVKYGTNPQHGETVLKAETIFPLLAAWLMLTTHGPDASSVDPAAIACVANLDPDSVTKIMNHYDAAQFKIVRLAFQAAVDELSENTPPYGGHQCPDTIDTLVPVASLLGTPTPDLCSRKFEKSSKSTK